MTHDELLAKIDKDIKFVNEAFYKPNTGMLEIRDRIISRLYALRAVVELHKPDEFNHCGVCNQYLCETIQAIEKELG
jgi:hypothetical protein